MTPVKISVNKNGSLKIEGEVVLVDYEGKEFGLSGRNTIFLCRCGLSANKPFCDGKHKNGFEDACQAFELPAPKTV